MNRLITKALASLLLVTGCASLKRAGLLSDTRAVNTQTEGIAKCEGGVLGRSEGHVTFEDYMDAVCRCAGDIFQKRSLACDEAPASKVDPEQPVPKATNAVIRTETPE